MFGKIENDELVLAGSVIKGKNYLIVNPTDAQYLEKGYKYIVYSDKPEYDELEERLEEVYTEEGNNIIVNYTKVLLTDQEHNNMIKVKMIEYEQEQTPRLLREAALQESYALDKLQQINTIIAKLRKDFR